MKFRKKPIIVEAKQVRIDAQLRFEDLPFPDEAQYRYDLDYRLGVFDYLHSTWVRFEAGDWIIKGVKGEFYPCKPDIFEITYELVEDRP